MKLQGFNSAPPKNEELGIESEISEFGEQIKIAGSLTNNASTEASQTKILLLFYDAFQPPRIIWISTIELEEAIESDSSVDFEFNEKFDPRSLGYKIFAESDNSYSNIQNVEITPPQPQPLPEPTPPPSGDDTIPPELLMPSDIQVSVNDPNGAEITYSVKGIDNIDQIITPTCIPSSGSIFPVGETIVSCTVTDSSGNTDTDSFTVTVEFS